MNSKEQQSFSDFVQIHSNCRKKPKMSFLSNVKFQYVEMKVVQTGISPAYIVVCSTCGEKKDISDHESW